MLELKNISDFSDNSNEGKLLMAALAILTSIDVHDIKKNKWGGMMSPNKALKKVQDLANKIYFNDEYYQYFNAIERDKKLDKLFKTNSENKNIK